MFLSTIQYLRGPCNDHFANDPISLLWFASLCPCDCWSFIFWWTEVLWLFLQLSSHTQEINLPYCIIGLTPLYCVVLWAEQHVCVSLWSAPQPTEALFKPYLEHECLQIRIVIVRPPSPIQTQKLTKLIFLGISINLASALQHPPWSIPTCW